MKIAFFSATLLASGLAVASTPINGWYSSVFGGFSYLPDNISKTYEGTVFTHASNQGGYNAGLRLGFQNNPMRYEGEFTYINVRNSNFNANDIRQHNSRGTTYAALGMANVYYDFPEMVPCVAPFLGIGLGYAWVDATLNTASPYYYDRLHFKGSGSAFAYQGTAGLTYNFSENYALNIAYRYAGTNHVDNLGKVVQANLASVGVVYRFDEYNYK